MLRRHESSTPKNLLRLRRQVSRDFEKFYQAFDLDQQRLVVERICMKRWKDKGDCDVLKRVVLDLENMKNDSKRNQIARTFGVTNSCRF